MNLDAWNILREIYAGSCALVAVLWVSPELLALDNLR